MRYLYGESDEKFVKHSGDDELNANRILSLGTFKYRVHTYLNGETPFDKHDVSIVFKVTPDTLVNLAARVVDAIPLPSVFEWNNVQVCKWLRDYGYRQYQNTFRENMINGRTLLLLDAAALSAMNIKRFDEVKHIAYGIRMLFFFEMTKFARSISLPWQYLNELYKLFRVKTGLKYDTVRRTDLYRRMQILRAKCPNYTHWEVLERWLALEPPSQEPELFGGVRRFNLYRCKQPPRVVVPEVVPQPSSLSLSVDATEQKCVCIPPCRCFWTAERDTRLPWTLKCLPDRLPDMEYKLHCEKCMPPCTCKWSPRKYAVNNVLTCLQEAFPSKYGQVATTPQQQQPATPDYALAKIRLSYFPHSIKRPSKRDSNRSARSLSSTHLTASTHKHVHKHIHKHVHKHIGQHNS